MAVNYCDEKFAEYLKEVSSVAQKIVGNLEQY
jgi:hypothetical protein